MLVAYEECIYLVVSISRKRNPLSITITAIP